MPKRSQIVVIDAGHGGTRTAGASSPNNAVGPNGLLEKDLTLDLARRVRVLLAGSATVILTRDAAINLSLSERAGQSRRNEADLFVSLHLNGAAPPDIDATESWVARKANARSRRFAHRIVDRLAGITGAPNRGVRERDLGVLVPERHPFGSGACLIELAYLSNAAQARRLERDDYRDELARGIAESIREDLEAGSSAAAFTLGMGDGAPFVQRAVDDCWAKCKQLVRDVKLASNPSQKSAARVLAETGVKADANPYSGLTEKKLSAVIRASFESHHMPEVLLALWAKEGSTRMQTAAREVPHATTEANAKSIFRSEEYYIALGTDHFIDTTRPSSGGDNVWDSSDAAAPAHEKHFVSQVQALVKARVLSQDISSAINAELTITKAGGKFSVEPSVKFYSLSLLLADAFFTQLQGMSYPELNSIPVALNYLHWNMSESSFRAFLKSAEAHRQEPAHRVGGNPISIEEWALHTKPIAAEYSQPRTNAIRFLHYIDSYRPIFSNSITLIKPGIEDLPRVPANVTETGALSNVPVVYAGTRRHVPTADPALFRTAPDPVAVSAATLLPNPSTTADADIRDALTVIGATAAEVRAFENGGGLATLRPFAEAFGGAALQELIRRLRYTKRQILKTPHTYGNQVATKLGVTSAIEVLAPRLLLAIPGHFRELARRTTDEKEAFALENFGWLFMGSIRDAVRSRTGKNWWTPPSPVFVTPFSSTLPALTDGVQRMVLRSLLIDRTLSAADYQARFNHWKTGLAGRQWRMETGVDPASPAPGRPFYPQLVTLPAAVNIAAQKTQIDQAWTRRLNETDAKFPANSAQSTAALTRCENDRLERLGLTESASLGGLAWVYDYPKLEPAKPFTKLPVLTAIKPTFEQFCSTVYELGWNDLLFQTQGAFCFRGTKISGNAAAARRISNHGYGIAYDVMNHENEQGQRHATTDPRIVAVFDAFHFQWGLSFPTPDPMHFDYHP